MQTSFQADILSSKDVVLVYCFVQSFAFVGVVVPFELDILYGAFTQIMESDGVGNPAKD